MQEEWPNLAGSCCVGLQVENNLDTYNKNPINFAFSGNRNINIASLSPFGARYINYGD